MLTTVRYALRLPATTPLRGAFQTAWTGSRGLASTAYVLKKSGNKFYAVRRGRDTGVFSSWDQARQHVDGFPNAEYMAFGRKDAARAWLNREEYSGPRSTPELLIAYIDGGFRNGRAGIGIHWAGEPHILDISERVPGQKQSSDRAEVYALFRALETDPGSARPMTIFLDSEYVLNTFTTHLPKWRRTGKTTYANKDLVDRIETLLHERPVPCQLVKADAHTKDYGNEQADQLATAATALPDSKRAGFP